tara:strand:+ start:242 stop:1231 length:990 start_codon:yes stop_codon:yes gene_type:complete
MPGSKIYNVEDIDNTIENDNTIEGNNIIEVSSNTPPKCKRSNSIFDTVIPHSAVLVLLQSTLLIYDYGKNFTIHDPNETIETFVDKAIEQGFFHKLGLNNARRAAMLELKLFCPKGQIHTFIDDPNSDIQVGITINHAEKHFAVVFRGSESIKDWYYDLQIYKHKYKDKIWIHSGFYNQLHTDNIHLCIISKVQCILNEHPEYKLFVTGHSLGGALATLFGYILAHEFEVFVTVVSFASPRIGNYYWKKSFEEKPNLKHFRVTNNRDLIVGTPTINYYHVGTDIKLYEDSFYINVGKAHSCFDYTIFSNWSIADHSCESYYENLVKNIW